MANGTLGIRRAFGTIPATKTVVNAFSAGSVATARLSAVVGANKSVASGALTANTLSQILSVTGAGWCPALYAYTADATARTIRLQVVVDGRTVFDATSSSISTASAGIIVSGVISSTDASGYGIVTDGECLRFNRSLIVRIASSLTETDKVSLAYKLMLE